MLLGTQMHIITFIFVCIELVIFFYLIIYRLARPDDRIAFLNIVLIFLLIIYNVTGGLLPDPNLPGSVFTQLTIAYATGFITPCYFPYYVYKAFGLEKMRFHAYRGVFLFLMLPYFLFVIIYDLTDNLEAAKNLLIVPVLYAIWVIGSLYKAIRYKYKNDFSSNESREEVVLLFFSLTPWVGLPVIDFFDLGQAVEASITNTGFLLLLALQVKRHIKQIRIEHQKLIDSEVQLLNWNTKLQEEVNKRTRELEKINEQKTNTFVNLAHETKTPLTLINNYLDEYINKKGNSEELTVVKKSIDKLSSDIINLFDLERFNKGISFYNHDLISNFSEIINDNLVLFKEYASKRGIDLITRIADNVFIKADPLSLNRIINNLIENAIKFSNDGTIEVSLQSEGDKINFSVKDYGIGIPLELHKKIFEPYYQISNQKRSIQGMGLGLPIVQKVVQDLKGEIQIDSNPKKAPGTKISVILNKHTLTENESVASNVGSSNISIDAETPNIIESVYSEDKPTVVIVEDNVTMITYLLKKLSEYYNVYAALNGKEALKKIKSLPVVPDLIITDVMMDKVDGYTLAKIISNYPGYNHIPFIFLSAKATLNDKLFGLKLGAIDFMQKPFSIQELIQKIESILANARKQKQALLSTAIKAIGVQDIAPLKDITDSFDRNCKIYDLTTREKDIAKLICQGHKYKDIGETLFISERTVTKHAQNIFEKVRVSNKIELCNKLEASINA
jgi:signal transduction histidine kinase/DNA-binding NarL/FixJ family response regulator